MSALLAIRDLHVWFDLPHGAELHAVQGVSFALEPGDRMGLVGESGCGKTTTILAIMGLEIPPIHYMIESVGFKLSAKPKPIGVDRPSQ